MARGATAPANSSQQKRDNKLHKHKTPKSRLK
jgi:hypothetical protein